MQKRTKQKKSDDNNGIVNSFVTPDGERALQTFFGASFELSNKRILPEYFKNVSHVHLEEYLVYFEDVVSMRSKKFKSCVHKANIVFGNFQGVQTLTSCRDVAGIANFFVDTQIVVITDGSQGSYIKPPQCQIMKFEAPQIENVVDTTGAGDFFQQDF